MNVLDTFFKLDQFWLTYSIHDENMIDLCSCTWYADQIDLILMDVLDTFFKLDRFWSTYSIHDENMIDFGRSFRCILKKRIDSDQRIEYAFFNDRILNEVIMDMKMIDFIVRSVFGILWSENWFYMDFIWAFWIIDVYLMKWFQ